MSTPSADALFVNLKLLAACRPYEKLNTKAQFFELVSPEYSMIPQFLSRWWRGETRADALQKIHSMYFAASELMTLDTVSPSEKARLKQHIIQSVLGIESLKKTYETDKTTIAKLDCIMDVAVCVIDGERPEARDLSQLLVLPKAVAVPPPMLSGSSDSEDV
jgi:hypothetical protein